MESAIIKKQYIKIYYNQSNYQIVHQEKIVDALKIVDF